MPSQVTSQRPPRRSRSDWYAEVKSLYDSGMTGTAIAERLGVGHSFVYSLLNDPDGARERERKSRYQGVCIDCGGPTNGADGRGANAAQRCEKCSHAHQAETQRIWTRETIIEAIQRFAREHGRPPLASDWNHAERGDGYPPATACYQGANPNAPFPYWADAIEAAGFPRPHVGGYERTGLAGIRRAGLYVLARARQRPVSGITAPQIAAERSTTVNAARNTLRQLEQRGLLYRDDTGRGSGAVVYKAVTTDNGASA